MLLTLILLFQYVAAMCTDAAKVLMLPGSANSHILFFSKLGEALSVQGNEVELLYPSNTNFPVQSTNTNFTPTPYKVEGDVAFGNSKEASVLFMEMALTTSAWVRFNKFIEYNYKYKIASERDCVLLIENKDLISRLKKSSFQMVILDPVFAPECFHSVALELNISHAYFSGGWFQTYFRVPRLPSFSAVIGTGYSDVMSFKQRLSTVIMEFMLNIVHWQTDSSTYYAKKYNHDPSTSFHNTFKTAKLWLYLEDSTVGYPRPNMPNTVSIGDIMAKQPVKPIPKDLETILNDLQGNVILVSFGSFFDYVPEYVTKKLCDAFRQLNYQVIWKLKDDAFCKNVKNVKIMKWIPQNDLLAHEKIGLFITHGGFNSLIEAVSHAKPVIVFPIALDQPDNAEVASSKGYGIRMDIRKFEVEELLANIEKIFQDPSYLKNIQTASAVLKDKPSTPGERASFLINHVIKHGDKHLRTGAYHLTLFQFFMFDICIFIFVSLLVVYLLIIFLFWRLIRHSKNRYYFIAGAFAVSLAIGISFADAIGLF